MQLHTILVFISDSQNASNMGRDSYKYANEANKQCSVNNAPSSELFGDEYLDTRMSFNQYPYKQPVFKNPYEKYTYENQQINICQPQFNSFKDMNKVATGIVSQKNSERFDTPTPLYYNSFDPFTPGYNMNFQNEFSSYMEKTIYKNSLNDNNIKYSGSSDTFNFNNYRKNNSSNAIFKPSQKTVSQDFAQCSFSRKRSISTQTETFDFEKSVKLTHTDSKMDNIVAKSININNHVEEPTNNQEKMQNLGVKYDDQLVNNKSLTEYNQQKNLENVFFQNIESISATSLNGNGADDALFHKDNFLNLEKQQFLKKPANDMIITPKTYLAVKKSKKIGPYKFYSEYKQNGGLHRILSFKKVDYNKFVLTSNIKDWNINKNKLYEAITELFPPNPKGWSKKNNNLSKNFGEQHMSDMKVKEIKNQCFLIELANKLKIHYLETYFQKNCNDILKIEKKLYAEIKGHNFSFNYFVEIHEFICENEKRNILLNTKQLLIILNDIFSNETNELLYLYPELSFIKYYIMIFITKRDNLKPYNFQYTHDLIAYLNAIYAIKVLKKIKWKTYILNMKNKFNKLTKNQTFYKHSRIKFCEARIFVQYLLSYLLNPFLGNSKGKIFLGKIIIEEIALKNINLTFKYSAKFKHTVFGCNNMFILYTFITLTLDENTCNSLNAIQEILLLIFKICFIRQLRDRPTSYFLANIDYLENNLLCFRYFFEIIRGEVPPYLLKLIDEWMIKYQDWSLISDKKLKKEHAFRKVNSYGPPNGIITATKIYGKTLNYMYGIKRKN